MAFAQRLIEKPSKGIAKLNFQRSTLSEHLNDRTHLPALQALTNAQLLCLLSKLPLPMRCTINRRSQFSASHRYWLPELSAAENQRLFGKCTQAPGHGHNYVVNVSLASELDRYGMVLNLGELKAIMQREVIDDLDFSHLNDVWAEFSETLPTTENIARIIWQRLTPHMPKHSALMNVQVLETAELWADYQGNDMEAYLTVSHQFSAAHRLALAELSDEENDRIYGKCARPHGHGHNYQLEVTVKGSMHPRTGMIVDLVALQTAIEQTIVEPLDHTFLNKDIPYFIDTVPTAENIAAYICQQLRQPIAEIGASLHKVKLIESSNNSAEVLASDCVATEALGAIATLTTLTTEAALR
jgi:6-pyruvoyltetrahydropterin/6-carboxytetrahydropterin synthase